MTIANIIAEARKLVDADSVSYIDADILRRLNVAYEQIVGRIMTFDGNWQFDDTNYTDFPIGTATLVAGQKDYVFDTSHLAIEKVGVLDENGKEYFLTPLDRNDLDTPWDEYFPTDGKPEYYDKDGGSVILGPGPATGSVTMAAGLIVYFRRTAKVFTAVTDAAPGGAAGSALPGFASLFHIVLAYKVALPYAATYKKDRVAWLISEIEKIEGNEDKGITGSLERFYVKRERDERNFMTTSPISFR